MQGISRGRGAPGNRPEGRAPSRAMRAVILNLNDARPRALHRKSDPANGGR